MLIRKVTLSVFMLSSTTSFADLSISENLKQSINKIERPLNCEVREDITRHQLPSTPRNMSLSEFGQSIIGWGTRPEGALEKIQNLHLSDIQHYQNAGVTEAMLQEWQAFYQNETKRNSCNPTAPIRAKLMQDILKMWF